MRPSEKTTQEACVASPAVCEMSKHSTRKFIGSPSSGSNPRMSMSSLSLASWLPSS